MRKVLIVCLLLISINMLAVVSAVSAAEKKTHKPSDLRVWTAWPMKNAPGAPANQIFVDLVNYYGKDVNLSARLIGGPEVFGTFQGIEAQLAGLYEIAVTAPSYYMGLVPEADTTMLNEHSHVESRKLGIFDLLDKFHQRKGLKYLSWWTPYGNYRAYSNFDTPKPDLTGKVMRSTPIYDPLIRALGGTPTTIAPGEIYDALARGVVDGFFWINQGIKDFRWHEQVKYYWGQPLPYVAGGSLTMNLKAWNKLDKDQQAVLANLGELFENIMYYIKKKDTEDQYEALITSGVLKYIKFSEADYKYFRKTALDTAWNYFITKSPDAAKLKPLMQKKD